MPKIRQTRQRKQEHIMHRQLADWIKYQYPSALYNTDMSGVPLSPFQAKTAKRLRSRDKYPDLAIYEPFGEDPSALFIELKRERKRLTTLRAGKYREKGDWRSDHISYQARTIRKLLDRGYIATFGIGFRHTKKIITHYMNGDRRIRHHLIYSQKKASEYYEKYGK